MKRRWRWFFYVGGFGVLLGLFFFQQKNKEEAYEEAEQRNEEAEHLLHLDLAKEAWSILQSVPEGWRNDELVLRTLLQLGRAEEAARYGLSQNIQDVSLWDKIFSAFTEKRQERKAYLFLDALSNKPEMSAGMEKLCARWKIKLLRVYQEQSMPYTVRAAWAHDHFGIVQKNEQFFLIGKDGTLDTEGFDELYSTEEGFLVRRAEQWMQWDGKGQYVRLEQEPDFDQKRLISDFPSSRTKGGEEIVSCEVQGEYMNFCLQDEALLPEHTYKTLSAINTWGYALGERENQWILLYFPALDARNGIRF